MRFKLAKQELELQTKEVRVLNFITLRTLSFVLGFFGLTLNLAFGQGTGSKTATANSKSTASANAATPAKAQAAKKTASVPRKKSKTKEPVLEPLQADGIIRVENSAPTKPIITARAEDVGHKVPKAFIEKMLIEGLWLDSVEKAGTPANIEMQALISALTSGMAANSIADQIIRNDETYKLKIQLIRYFEKAPSIELAPFKLTQSRITEIKSYITQKYLAAVFSVIHGSTISDYNPIVSELRDRLQKRLLYIVDLTPELRHSWNAEKTQIKVHQYENFGLEEKKDGQYLVNGIYIDSKKTFAFDLSRSKEENLVTIAHEIVHAADPELIQQKAKLAELYSKVVEKLKPHLQAANAEMFVKALIQDTFYEMGRFDFIASMQQLRDNRVDQLKLSLEKQPLENLTKDSDFKDFMRSLIAITVENEYKAYTLSYALYQNLKNNRILPPLLSRNKFMQAQFQHAQSLPFTLSVAMNPFAKNTYMGSMNIQNSPELANTVNQIKAIFEINYLEQSKVMMTEVGQRYAQLFQMIQKESEMANDENIPAWTRPGNFDSPTNPFQILEAKVSTAWTLRFKLNLQAFLKKIVGLQETLLGMRAGMMDLHDVTFGELKMLGMQPETIQVNGQWVDNVGQFLPTTMNNQCRAEFLRQITTKDVSQTEEYLSYFNELRWQPEIKPDRTPIKQSEVMVNLYRLNLLKAVRWLRIEMPLAQENIVGIKTMLSKLHTGQYDPNEITPERAKELSDDLKTYLEAAAVSGDEFKNVEALMTAVSQMYYMALESKWQPVSEEFYKRIMGARRFLEDIGYQSKISFTDIKTKMIQDVESFKGQIRTEFKACANEHIDFYSWNKKFTLGRIAPFVVTGICYNKELYIFRQGCDYNGSASTTVPEGRPQTKIFIGGREIKLDPFETFGK